MKTISTNKYSSRKTPLLVGNRLLPLLITCLVSVWATSLGAQTVSPANDNVHFAWADVLRVNPQYEYVMVTREQCDNRSDQNSSNAAVDSGVRSKPHPVEIGCRRTENGGYEQRRITGYEVEYRYRGEIYMSHLLYDPGDRLRVRVSVTPAE